MSKTSVEMKIIWLLTAGKNDRSTLVTSFEADKLKLIEENFGVKVTKTPRRLYRKLLALYVKGDF